MKTYKTIFLFASLIVIMILSYLNFNLEHNEITSNYDVTNYNSDIKTYTFSSGENKTYHSNDNYSDNTDFMTNDFGIESTNESYRNSIENISTNHSLNSNYSDYKESSYSHNSNNMNSNNISIPIISSHSSHSSPKNVGSEYSENLTSVSTTTSPEIDAVNYANGPSKCEPVKCGHNVWIDGYWEYHHHHHKTWICGYWKWIDEDCNPSVPVGDGTLILISLLIIYAPIKIIKFKKTSN